MISATADEIRALAKGADTSREYLYQVANGHRHLSPELAGQIEVASGIIRNQNKKTKARLPLLTRGVLAGACAGCPYFKKCSKNRSK